MWRIKQRMREGTESEEIYKANIRRCFGVCFWRARLPALFALGIYDWILFWSGNTVKGVGRDLKIPKWKLQALQQPVRCTGETNAPLKRKRKREWEVDNNEIQTEIDMSKNTVDCECRNWLLFAKLFLPLFLTRTNGVIHHTHALKAIRERERVGANKKNTRIKWPPNQQTLQLHCLDDFSCVARRKPCHLTNKQFR